VFMAVTVPVAQSVLKRQLLPKAELLPFMRALAFGLAATGAIVLAIFIPWMVKHAPAGMTAAVADLQAQLGSPSVRVPPSYHRVSHAEAHPLDALCHRARAPCSCGAAPASPACGASCWPPWRTMSAHHPTRTATQQAANLWASGCVPMPATRIA